jgi:hypothetical protein
MLRVRMFPLRVNGGDEKQIAAPPEQVIPILPNPRVEESYDRLSKDKEKELFKSSMCLSLFRFAQCVCVFHAFLFFIAAVFTIGYESGDWKEKFNFRVPLTQTATVWVPFVNGTVPPNDLTDSCKTFVGSDFYGSGAYPRQIIFEFRPLRGRFLVLASLLCGFLFQLVNCIDEEGYYEPFTVGNSHITGYLERSISMPLFVMVLLTQIGISDVLTIVGLVFNAWAAMLFSFFAEILFQGDGGFLLIGQPVSANTVENGGGFYLYKRGIVHYHALAMLFSLGQFGVVVWGLLFNGILVHECLPSQPALSRSVSWVLYAIPALYGLGLGGQALISYIKKKPSTVKQDRTEMIARWREKGDYTGGLFNENQNKELRKGAEDRAKYALFLEFYYIILDLFIKMIMFSSLFLFELH